VAARSDGRAQDQLAPWTLMEELFHRQQLTDDVVQRRARSKTI
jgi:hypothetical protein